MMATSDSLSAAVAARKAERGSARSCNPETEFRLGHASRDAEVTELKLAIAETDASMVTTPAGFRDRFWERTHTILKRQPADVVAEHSRKVKAEALNAFADRLSGDYALDQSTPAALLAHIVSLARRDAAL